MKINFVAEYRALMYYSRNNVMPLRERMLWLALFTIANERAVYDGENDTYEWPEDFMPVSNGELELYSTLDKRAIDTLRNNLKQRGLIEFTPGLKNSKPPMYKLNYLTGEVGYKNAPKTSLKTDFGYNNVPNNVPKTCPEMYLKSVQECTQNVSNNVPNMSPYPKYNKIKPKYGNEGMNPAADIQSARAENLISWFGEITESETERAEFANYVVRSFPAGILECGMEILQDRVERGKVHHPCGWLIAFSRERIEEGCETREDARRNWERNSTLYTGEEDEE